MMLQSVGSVATGLIARAYHPLRYHSDEIGRVVPLLIYIPHSLSYWNFTMEDAYISFRYAEQLASGFGLVFNPGERVEGYTNFLWVILLAISKLIYNDTLLVAKLLGVTSGVLTLIFLFELGKRISGEQHWSGLIAPLLFALYPGVAIWSIAGLESVLFTCLLVLSYYFYVSKSTFGSLGYGVAFALAATTRPEGILFFAIAWGNEIFWKWHERKTFTGLTRVAFTPLIPFILIVGTWEVWRLSFYGYPLPNTFYLKVSDPFRLVPISQGFPYIGSFWNTIGGWFFFGFCLLFLFSHSSRSWKSLTIVTIFAWLGYIHMVNGDWMPWYRFFIPVLPLIFLTAQQSINYIMRYSLKISLALTGILISGFVITAMYTFRSDSVALSNYGRDAVGIGQWLAQHADSEALIAVTNAGAIPYYSKLRTLDYFGLLNPTFAHTIPKEYKLDIGDGKVQNYLLSLDVDWLLDQKPDLIEIPGMLKDGQLYTYAPSAKLIYVSPRFMEEFDPKPIATMGSEMVFRANHFQGIVP